MERQRCLLSLALTCLLCACQSPVVPVRKLAYVVAFEVNGTTYQLKTVYQCHLEDVAWVSERGAEWHIRSPALIRALGVIADGSKVEAQPIDPRFTDFSPAVRCTDHDVAIYSVLFVAWAPDVSWIAGVDSLHSNLAGNKIQITESKVEFLGSTYGIFQPAGESVDPSHQPRGSDYYTISAEILAGDEIDRRHLRDYVNGRKSIWLQEGKTLEFVRWDDEDVDAARKYEKQLNLYGSGGFLICGQKKGDTWAIELNSSQAMQWYPSGITDPRQDRFIGHEEAIPRQWVLYKQSRIQLPLALYQTRNFYDPAVDQLVLLHVDHADLVLRPDARQSP
jgi:hypothetical protein